MRQLSPLRYPGGKAKFYNNIIKSNITNVSGITNEKKLDYLSLIYNIKEFILPFVPIISKTPGNYIKIKLYELRNLELTLVDEFDKTIEIKSPISIILEVIYEKDYIPMFYIN